MNVQTLPFKSPQFDSLTLNSYGGIIADPPWFYKLYSKKGENKSPQNHYSCMTIGEIKDLPVRTLAGKDCLLFLWTTSPMVRQGLEVLDAWGFEFKTMGAWHKKTKHGRTAFGTGYIFRSAAEFFLIATIGRPKIKSRSIRNLIETPIRGHSIKPDEQYKIVENLVQGPYCELFARRRRQGWDGWGAEYPKRF